MKNIVICSDGTGNTAIKGRGTNVFKLYEAVDFEGHRTDPNKIRQIGFYDDGVGTSRIKALAALGGAFGIGLGRNVRQLYADLARVYEPGDGIFLFGFSRGAFTVRTLSGLIAACGIVDRCHRECRSDGDLRDLVSRAYRAYRDRYRTRLMQLFRGPASDKPPSVIAMRTQCAVQHAGDRGADVEPWQVPIAFVGVWDTVDAVGFPIPGVAALWNETFHRFKFPDHVLGPMIERARHALAIDDERHSFHPLLWDEEPKGDGRPKTTAAQNSDRIKQVWFSGVHSNVGGGYPKQGLSVVSLAWMMDEVEQAWTLPDGTKRPGLRFSPGDRQLYHERQNVYDKLYDSRAGVSCVYRYMPRNIVQLCQKSHVQPRLHVSVAERCMAAPAGYAPGNIPRDTQVERTVPEVTKTMQRMKELEELKELAKYPSMLDHVRRLIILRRVTSFVVLGIAALATIMALTHAQWKLSELSAYGLLRAMGEFILYAVTGARWWVATLLLAMLAAYGINWLVARKMHNVFSTFWCRVR
jgi:uncharacterized protein (DUF2235 family)